MRNLLVRTATGVVFVAVVLACILLGRASYFVLLAVIAAGCVWELWALTAKPGNGLRRWLGIAYIIASVGLMVFFPPRFAVAFVLTVWANDVFAYLTGITFGSHGKHKMCPRLSPKKSWEGFAGGLVGAVTVAVLAGRFWLGGSNTDCTGIPAVEGTLASGNIWFWMAFGLLVALAAVAGDLTESWLKRRAGVKDSGTLLPGHGGMLDRFDAMLGAAPVAFLFFIVTMLAK